MCMNPGTSISLIIKLHTHPHKCVPLIKRVPFVSIRSLYERTCVRWRSWIRRRWRGQNARNLYRQCHTLGRHIHMYHTNCANSQPTQVSRNMSSASTKPSPPVSCCHTNPRRTKAGAHMPRRGEAERRVSERPKWRAYANSHSRARGRACTLFWQTARCAALRRRHRVSSAQMLPRHDNDDDVLASEYLNQAQTHVCKCVCVYVENFDGVDVEARGQHD